MRVWRIVASHAPAGVDSPPAALQCPSDASTKRTLQVQLNQRSDGVVIIDSACHTQEDCVQGYLIISVWVSEATGAESGNVFEFRKVDISIMRRYHLRFETGGSPLDRAHKYGIGTALMPCQDFNSLILELLYSKRPWQQGMSHVQRERKRKEGTPKERCYEVCHAESPSLHIYSFRSRVANIHATKDGCTRAAGWSCECTDFALLHVAAELLLVLLNRAGLAAALRECLGQTQRPDQLHQVRVTSETRHPWHKARNYRNSAKPQ
eukprot:1138909-Pelagomonas_calceolata.AAC.1